MPLDLEYVKKKQQLRIDSIMKFCEERELNLFTGAVQYDQEAPITTNRIMLNEAGLEFETVTSENYREIIDALKEISITVLVKPEHSEEKIIETLNKIVNEEVNEIWGGEGFQEFVEIFDE
jgi:ADP-heptose:LPS heptosyltransferase